MDPDALATIPTTWAFTVSNATVTIPVLDDSGNLVENLDGSPELTTVVQNLLFYVQQDGIDQANATIAFNGYTMNEYSEAVCSEYAPTNAQYQIDTNTGGYTLIQL
jgi:hypothetical protein